VNSVPWEFEWDPAKAESNLAKHGVSFDVAIAAFADPAHRDLDTSRTADGEERRKVVGLIQERLITVVYTMRGRVCRLISARRANAKERRSYGYRSSSS
jgi:uncharacterized protein